MNGTATGTGPGRIIRSNTLTERIMGAIIKPTVGRIVLYHQMADRMFPGSGSPRAAIVANVNENGTVNLCVIDADGGTHGRDHIQLVQPGDEIPKTAHCYWMDYQLGQAAKTEAAEAKLNPAAATAGV